MLVCACTDGPDEQSACPTSGEFRYEGVALATAAGDSSFALANDCPFFVSGSEAFYESVREAWTKSPYQDHLRPIFLSAVGRVEAREEGFAPVFWIRSVSEVSVDFSKRDARDQFQLRMGRDPVE